jgi:carbon storage regulator
MLVLSRRANQSIVIGDDIVVTVLDVRGDQVRLGIQAPRHLPVHRKEVFAQIQRENQAAAAVTRDDTALLPRPPG